MAKKKKVAKQPTYVYGIMCYTYLKIGVARDVLNRFLDLQGASPFELDLVWCARCPSRSAAFTLEKQLHEQFARQRVRGEWFTLDVLDSLPLDGMVENSRIEFFTDEPWSAVEAMNRSRD